MDKFRELIEDKKRKGEARRPRYATRNLSIGLVSCMLGYFLFYSAPVTAHASEIDSNSVEAPQTQVVETARGGGIQDLTVAAADSSIAETEANADTVQPAIASTQDANALDTTDDDQALTAVDAADTVAQESSATSASSANAAEASVATEDAGTEAVAPITAAATRSMGDRDASGNTWVETPGYTKSGKYNFSDLEFAPEDLTGDITLDSNQINFEIYGKHNIAASGNNWEIRLQIDERIASHITEIKVDPNAGPSAGRRTLTRISDELGRPTNIWKVNYIRASNGLFAGAETTDTQTAPNGAITLDTNLREILTEIGHDKLTSDRLLHRIYLVSHQDNDQIVAGIESSGYFVTGDNETLNNLAVSENNPDQFKHGSVSATYVKPNTSTSDNTGTTGPSGAIVVDHKLTKESNFAYGLTAKGTPWNLEFKVDPRLVPYTQGIELHKVDASKVAYDVGYTTGTKVENLSIEKDPTRANYGQGTITNNDLTQLVNWSGGSPRPVVIRYVIKLTKPLNEILKEMKGAAGVEGNAPFGDDLIFDAWVTDSNHDLINNTFGSGFYYLQDIDGDSTPDDEEQQHQTSPYVGTPKLNKVYDTDTTVKGQVYLDELAGGADQKNTVRLIAKDGTVLAEQEIIPLEEDGTPKSGVVEFTFNNVDATKLNAGEDLTVQVVSKGYDAPEEGTTTILEAPKAADKQEVSRGSTPSAKDAIKNNANLPEDATYEWKAAPDTSAVATDVPGTVTVTIDDRTFDVDVKYDVVATNADDYAPAYGGVETAPGKEVTSGAPTFSKDGGPVDLTDVPLADAGPFAVGALDPSRGSATVTDGGVVTFTPAAGVGEAGPETVAVPVEVTYADGSKETVELVVTVGRDVYGIDEGGAVPDGYHRVTLVLGAGTALKDPAAKTHFAVRDGKALGGSLPEVEATEGYKDAKWPDGAASTAIERDETFTSSATELLSHRYEPKADGVEKEHGAPTTEDDVKGAVTVPGYPADGEQPRVTVDDPGQLPDGNTPGDHRVDVTVTYPDGSTDHAQVTVTVKDVVATNADDYAPAYGGVETAPGKEVTSGAPTFSKDGRPVDLGDVPLADAGPFAIGALDPSRGSATVTDGGVVTFAPAAGVGEAGPETVAVPVEVTYADGSKETVELVVTVGRDVYGIDEGGAVPDGYHRVTLVLGAGTALKDPAAKTHFAVRDGKALGGSLPEVEATEGYKDAKWPDGAASTAIERDETFTSSATELLSHRYEPKADDVEKEHGAPTTEDDVKGAVTVPGYPADGEQPRVTVDDPGQLPDGNTPGDHRVDVTVTYPDGSTDHAQVTVTVTVKQEGFKATVKNPPAQIEGQPVADNTTVISANKGFTVVDVTTNGANAGLSIDANGNLVGTPSGLTWGDKDSATYEEQTITLTAEVTSEDGKSTETVRVAVVVQRDTDGDKEPDATDKNDDNDGYGDEEEIKKGSDPKDANSVPQVAKTETAAMKTGPDKVKKPTNSLPKTGDATTGAAAGLVAAAGGTLLLLGLRKKKEEGSEQE